MDWSFGEEAGERRPAGMSLVDFVNIGLRHRRLVLAIPVAVCVLTVLWVVLSPRSYTARASFVPLTSKPSVSRLADLAAQFGMSLPEMETGRGPEFQAALLNTDEILRAAVVTEYELEGAPGGSSGSRAGDLVRFFGIGDEDEPPGEREIDKAVEKLRDRLSVDANRETGVVAFALSTRWPGLSEAVTRRLLGLVDELNQEMRRSQLRAQREFFAERLRDAERDLLEAEEALERFLDENRKYEQSPELRFRFQRLERRVGLEGSVYRSLAESLAEAEIEEVRNTPVITVVQSVRRPSRPDPLRLPYKAFLGLVVGALIAVGIVTVKEFVRSARDSPSRGFTEFLDLKREAAEEVRALVRRTFRRT